MAERERQRQRLMTTTVADVIQDLPRPATTVAEVAVDTRKQRLPQPRLVLMPGKRPSSLMHRIAALRERCHLPQPDSREMHLPTPPRPARLPGQRQSTACTRPNRRISALDPLSRERQPRPLPLSRMGRLPGQWSRWTGARQQLPRPSRVA